MSHRRPRWSVPRRPDGSPCATAWSCWCVRARPRSTRGPASVRQPTSCDAPSSAGSRGRIPNAELTRRIDRAVEQAGLPLLERTVWVEVDIDALTANAVALRSLAQPAALGAVVKADGYGHGLEMAGRCAVAGGAEWLCVADAAEAVRLRRDGYPGRMFVLYPVPPGMASTMARLAVDVTVGSTSEARD